MTYISISKISLLEKNPRKITKEQFEKLCRNLQEDELFFESRPCLINDFDGKLICYAGNQRLRAAKQLGWKEVPCHVEKNVSPEVQKKRIVLDNIHHGEFDFDLLAALYDFDELLDLGMLERELGIGKDIPELEDNSDEPLDKKKKEKKCPNCGWDL